MTTSILRPIFDCAPWNQKRPPNYGQCCIQEILCFTPCPFFLRCEVKVFTLSGSHQQYQSHLCESFSWKCCTSLKYFSLGLRSRKKEKKLHTETFKAILHKRGNPGLRQDFHCQLRHILSSGQTTTQMLRRRKRRRRRQRRGLILLWSSLLFWLGLSSRCVVMERLAKPAGIEDTGWPQPDTEATWS